MLTVVILLILAVALYFGTRRRNGTVELAGRVDFLERRVAELQTVIDDLRPARPTPPPRPRPAPVRPQQPAPGPTMAPRPRTPRPEWRPPQVSVADLMGAKALAFAGGVVTLLGVVFFFVLAVNRGWIGPELRVAAGAFASATVFGTGLWLQRKSGTTYASLVAVGVGIAGAYVTLLAATSLYDLVPTPVALVVAGVIGAVGLAVSLAWSSEIVAAFGLIGAMAVPATLVFQGGLREVGTAFVAIVFAATAIVAVQRRWWKLLQAAALVSVPQVLAQVAGSSTAHTSIVALAVVFWLLYVAAGIAFQLRRGTVLAGAPVTFLIGSAVFGGACVELIFQGSERGWLLLGVAALYLALAAALFRRARDLALVVGAIGLAVAAVGFAQSLSGPSLTYAWAADAALLAWVGSRLRDTRVQLAALAYLVLAVVHALAVEARPDRLFADVLHPAKGAPALVLIALAALVFGLLQRSWDDSSRLGQLLRAHERHLDVAAYTLSALAALYAVSLGILELGSFDWGHVAVTATWCTASVTALALAIRARSNVGVALAFVGLGLTIVKVLGFDVLELGATQHGTTLVIAGGAALSAALLRDLTARALTPEGASSVVASLFLSAGGGLVLWSSGYVLLLVGGAYVLLAAAVLRYVRDLSTALWSLGLATAAVGAALLLDGTWLVLAYAAAAATLAVLSVVLHERRLQAASLAYLGLGAGYALVAEAPPTDLVTARLHPGYGAPSLLLVVTATLALGWALGWSRRGRAQALWIAGGLAVYAASLAILEAAQRISPAGVHTDFQRGHTVVSAFWGCLALVSLYLGLKRRHGVLRGGGFVLFAISLGKLFLFDLPSLSSVQRALSFLAVGAVLLLGGFFYQRISAQYDEAGPRIA